MVYDVSAQLTGYQNVFSDYPGQIQTIRDLLEASFNFGKSPSDVSYYDFWQPLSQNLATFDLTAYYNEIITPAQKANDLITDRYMALIGMVSQLDNYMCFAIDSFSRVTDVAWGYGTGTVYNTVYGIFDTETSTYEILRKGLDYYKSQIGIHLTNINDIVNLMDRTRANDSTYLADIRDNKIIPEIIGINLAVADAELELAELVELANQTIDYLEIWLPKCFKMLATVSLTFNLNNKAMRLADKSLPDGSPINREDAIGVSVAKYWITKVSPDFTNRGDCMTEAILQGLNSIAYTGYIENYLNLTWDKQIPKL